jgi:hypothetical protein
MKGGKKYMMRYYFGIAKAKIKTGTKACFHLSDL